jgi:CubicO group peptidase (beta-lactamase class C family)
LSKPIFAHTVLQLVDHGFISLDVPLDNYFPGYLPGDPRSALITARHVLSHCAGLPNWRNAEFPLRTYFEPGVEFSYSGEGYLFLQKAVESVMGEKIDGLIDRLVFQPFAMTRSSFVWDRRFDDNRAYPHDAFGRPALSYKPGEANAAWSAQTCAADFGRFLMAVLEGAKLKPETYRLWLHPHAEVKHKGIQCLGPREQDITTRVAWGLGWGLKPEEGTFFHWGDNGPFTAFTIGSVVDGNAVVIFTNGASGLSIMPELLAPFRDGERPSLMWLDYVRHNSRVRRMLRVAHEHGIEQAWEEFDGSGLDEGDLLWIGQGLIAFGREEDGLWLRQRIKERASGDSPLGARVTTV